VRSTQLRGSRLPALQLAGHWPRHEISSSVPLPMSLTALSGSADRFMT